MRKKRIWIIAITLFVTVAFVIGICLKLIAPSESFTLKPLLKLQERGILTNIYTEQIVIPELTQSYRFMVINDIHVIVANEEIMESEKENVTARQHLFTNQNQVKSTEIFQAVMDAADEIHADGIFMIGDIIDFYSLGNAKVIEDAMEQVQTPLIYVGADHDHFAFYSEVSQEEMNLLNQKIVDNPVQILEYDEFSVVGIENSTSQLSEKGWEQTREVLTTGKPVLLLSHVPYQSLENNELEVLSEQTKGDRKLLWGTNCYYQPDATTAKLLDAVYQEDTNVAAVLSGHLHFPYRTMLTKEVVEYVCAPSYLGIVTIIELIPKESLDTASH
ncbi:MAG: metallophosphoesterase [Lachnospiraceae bacterium]|jgi:hypothetical protein|nr:metallophosphoesterase [Lachnospiraceae bacterium]